MRERSLTYFCSIGKSHQLTTRRPPSLQNESDINTAESPVSKKESYIPETAQGFEGVQKAAAAPIPDKHLQAVADRFQNTTEAAEEG